MFSEYNEMNSFNVDSFVDRLSFVDEDPFFDDGLFSYLGDSSTEESFDLEV